MITNRKDINHNFLRRVILRLDYDGVVDIKDTLKILENYLPNYGFVEMRMEFISEAEFKLDDPNMIESQLSIPLKDLNKIETFKYISEDKNMLLEINKLYMALTINTEKYIKFEDYSSTFVDIFNRIKAENIYLNPTRLGLRKINDCIIKDKNNFQNYFNKDYFSDITEILNKNKFCSEKINTEFIDTIVHNEFMFNYGRVASSALLEIGDKEYDAYQVVIDIDGYTHESCKLNNIISDCKIFKENLAKINEDLFELYINTLTPHFISNLKEENFICNDILGVSKNGES